MSCDRHDTNDVISVCARTSEVGVVLQPGTQRVVDRVPQHVQDFRGVKPLRVHPVHVQEQIDVVELQ